MCSTDFIFRQQENLVDNQKCQAGFRPLCNKILLLHIVMNEPFACHIMTKMTHARKRCVCIMYYLTQEHLFIWTGKLTNFYLEFFKDSFKLLIYRCIKNTIHKFTFLQSK